MTARLHWTGVRMRTLTVTTDPDDSLPRSVIFPTVWDDDAAQAIAQLTPHEGPIRLATEAARWVDMLDALPAPDASEGEGEGEAAPINLGRSLSYLLLMRQIAPNIALWQNRPDETPGFVVKLSSFVQDGCFASEHYIACIKLACSALRRLHSATRAERSGELPLFDVPTVPACETAGLILLSDLDACLANMGLDYDSNAGRQVARAVSAVATSIARAGTRLPAVKIPTSDIPDLEKITQATNQAFPDKNLAIIETGFSSSGPIDAILGVEACGLAPIFSPLQENGHLRASTLARLSHKGLTVETALAMAISGENPLPPTNPHAHHDMQQALSGYVDFMPELPEPDLVDQKAKLARGIRRPLPLRQSGFTQKTSVGGHSLFMRTSEFEDGTLGEISITPPKESPMAKGLMDCLGHAVSIGLQFGAPLEAFVERFAYTRFGPAGTVEGDPKSAYASSIVDYAFRTLSEAYLGVHMPDAPQQEKYLTDQSPMLPFDGAPKPPHRNSRLKLVS
ncbi:TSCPD domain-containing protein [Swingsia samuiensis]|uniref:ribonucleoside-diphosphate reductase n=1 Tax=Swingsia samuiensis TaxID=1293412 RepID=A0A4Y6UH82_9PROT|nr:vitamin B12-dependent ribonucleotide reductase [Swingsia samuiensis]QDH16949.1 vitamin B12-dependent ribonucleotide reductase [Swingsia samuiensis]